MASRRLLGLRAPPRRQLWGAVKPVPPDPILGLVARFKKDPNPKAVNLAQGAYRDGDGKPFVLPSVVKAERRVLQQLAEGSTNKEYLGSEGNPDFLAASIRFAFGEHSNALAEKRVAAIQVTALLTAAPPVAPTDRTTDFLCRQVQSLSGTGALRLAADTLKTVAGVDTIFISDPSWGNHRKIFEAAGLRVESYTYLDKKSGTTLDFDGLLSDLRSARIAPGSVVLLHCSAHNPTGVDPTPEQWRQLADVFAARKLVPLFDSAYQGYASGDPDVDAFAIREFDSRGKDAIPAMLVCQSYAKNMGLYGERVGALAIVAGSAEAAANLHANITTRIIRPMYSSPPVHGSRLATVLLTDAELNAEWRAELKTMADRIISMREELVAELVRKGQPLERWRHISDQIGMFAYTGLTPEQVFLLILSGFLACGVCVWLGPPLMAGWRARVACRWIGCLVSTAFI